MGVDVELVRDEFVLHHLLEIAARCAEPREPVDNVLDEVEAVESILYAQVEGGGDRPLFVISTHVQVLVGPAIGETVDQRGIAVESEDDVLVPGEDGIEVCIGEAVRVLARRLELHEIDHVHHANLEIGQVLSKDRRRGEDLERRGVATAGQNDVGFFTLVVARPLPDAQSLGAVDDRLIHREPLGERVLPRDDHVHVVTTS